MPDIEEVSEVEQEASPANETVTKVDGEVGDDEVKAAPKKVVNVNKAGAVGFARTHLFAISQNAEGLRAEIENENGDVNAKDMINGKSPLHKACEYKNTECVSVLIEMGATVDSTDENGRTPLHHACERSGIEIAKLLVESGADIVLEDSEGRNALDWAASAKDPDCLEYLLQVLREQKGDESMDFEAKEELWVDTSGSTAAHKASLQGNVAALELLKDQVHGFDFGRADKAGRTALHWASYGGNVQAMDFIIKQGSDVDACDERGWAALHFAAFSGHGEAIQTLVTAGADPNKVDQESRTPLHWSALSGKNDSVRALLKGKASQLVQDESGCAPMHYCGLKAHYECLNLLLNNSDGKNAVELETVDGRTPEAVANTSKAEGANKCAELIRKRVAKWSDLTAQVELPKPRVGGKSKNKRGKKR